MTACTFPPRSVLIPATCWIKTRRCSGAPPLSTKRTAASLDIWVCPTEKLLPPWVRNREYFLVDKAMWEKNSNINGFDYHGRTVFGARFKGTGNGRPLCFGISSRERCQRVLRGTWTRNCWKLGVLASRPASITEVAPAQHETGSYPRYPAL